MTGGPTVVPFLFYGDGHGARRFLEEAFGLRTVFALDGRDGVLMHAEMAFGDGVVMIGTAGSDAGTASPGAGVYVVVEDVEAHHARATAAGAEIVYPPREAEMGTWRYSARDPEGHVWVFGSYRPQTTAPKT